MSTHKFKLLHVCKLNRKGEAAKLAHLLESTS